MSPEGTIVPGELRNITKNFNSGKTLHDIKGMSLDDQLTHFSKKQLAGTEEGLMEKFFIQNLLVTVNTIK